MESGCSPFEAAESFPRGQQGEQTMLREEGVRDCERCQGWKDAQSR